MKLTAQQIDALSELLNIAFGRAAASFSELAEQRVLLDTTAVRACEMSALRDALPRLVTSQGVTAHIDFAGPVSGDAFLVLGQADALLLVDLLMGAQSATGSLDVAGQEALAEVGNILLIACLGTLGNLLQANIKFSTPNLCLGALDSALDAFKVGRLGHALVASTAICLQEAAVSAHLLVVMDATDMERLLQAAQGMT